MENTTTEDGGSEIIDTEGLSNSTAQTDLYSQKGWTPKATFDSPYEVQSYAGIILASIGPHSGVLCGQKQLWVSSKAVCGGCTRSVFHSIGKKMLGSMDFRGGY